MWTLSPRPGISVIVRMLALLCLGVGLPVSCRHGSKANDPGAAGEIPAQATTDPGPAAIELAAARIADSRPEQALPWLAALLRANPSDEAARRSAGDLLGRITWHLPRLRLDHGMAVEQILCGPEHSMWVSLSGDVGTTVRWNLATSRVENVLFPTASAPTRFLVADARRQSIVVGRGETALLCDATTLKPIRDLGRLPEGVDPGAVLTFSADGLLLGHPLRQAGDSPGVVWQIRDAKSGEVVRSSDLIPDGKPAGIAASLAGDRLDVLLEDGTLVHMPVSPVESITTTPQEQKVKLAHARFQIDGSAAFALMDQGPHDPPGQVMIDFQGGESPTPGPLDLLRGASWSRHPSVWTGLMREAVATIAVDGGQLSFPGCEMAGVQSGDEITAIAWCGGELVVGTRGGDVCFYHPVSPAGKIEANGMISPTPGRAAADALVKLSTGLTGMRLETSGLQPVTVKERMEALETCDFKQLGALFPELDPKPWIDVAASFKPGLAAADALSVLSDRIVKSRAKPPFPGIEEAFANADSEAVTRAISESGGKGPAAALCLQLALGSTHPEWISACLKSAVDLPPLLRRIAVSRIAWLDGRKADAIAGWPDTFPDYSLIRQREDWEGWEAADFAPALEGLRLCVGEELAKLELPANATAEQRKALFDHLSDPATLQAVGKARFARACLRTALAFSAFKEETETTFKLASLARDLGEEPAPCLRAEAMSLTALGDYQQARDRWIELISNHPVATHEPGDYAEAAYTSFENADPRQAMAILTTGIHRFPNDANFALRAGWVALLTGNGERAYRFLLTGRQIGYPPDKLENATALMAIAAVQSGAVEDANVFYQDLMKMDPAWENPETIETLEWPEELKASLRQLAW